LKQLSSLHKISVSAFFILLSLTAPGSDPYHSLTGAGEAGMGYVCIMKSGFWTSFHNQASLAFNNSFSFGFNYENRFTIRELGTRSVGITIPVEKASIGVYYSHFGYSDFNRDRTGLACGMKLSEKLSAGVQIDYFSEKTSGEYANNQSITYETGLIITPSERMHIGIHIFNPVPNSIRKNYLPTTLRVGTGIDLNKLIFGGIEVEMSTSSNLIFRAGFEYEAEKNLWLRSGFSTDNNSFSFGLGYLLKIVKIDLGFVTHEKLGVSSSVAFIFQIG